MKRYHQAATRTAARGSKMPWLAMERSNRGGRPWFWLDSSLYLRGFECRSQRRRRTRENPSGLPEWGGSLLSDKSDERARLAGSPAL